jgi:diguanylate cyclase (GGDEF)-like protein
MRRDIVAAIAGRPARTYPADGVERGAGAGEVPSRCNHQLRSCRAGGEMEINVNTLLLINIAVLFLSSVAAIYFWRQYRDYVWLLWWSLATGLMAVGLVLVGLFGPVPPVPIGAPAAAMLLAGYVMVWESMRLFNGKQSHPMRVAAIVLVFFAMLVGSVLVGSAVGQRANLVSAGMLVFAALSAYEVSREGKHEFLRARLAMAGLFAVMTIVLAVRTLLPLLWPAIDTTNVFYDPLGGLSSLANSICAIGLSIVLMMMANERASDRHRRLAMTDELTGLPNRRYFLMQAEQRLRRRRKGAAACILMMDLDHFSEVNERFGHAGGDDALAWFASLLRQKLAANDLVARYGGEEFCALLTNASQARALAIAESIRAGLAAQPVTLQGRQHPVTVSIGVARLRNADITEALHDADQALYQAKAAGRNRVAAEDGSTVGLAAG